MKLLQHCFAVATLVGVALSQSVQAAAPDSFAPIIEPLMPAVVNISTTQKSNKQAVAEAPMFDFDGLPDTPQTRQFKQLFRQRGMAPDGPLQGKAVTSLGSGFVIDAGGYVVTNNHVIGDAEAITVIFHDNSHLPATLVGRDPKTDLALLKVKSDKPLPFVSFGDSDVLHVGDWVIAVGNPFGLGGSVSAGIVSARGRNINAGPFDDFIQTDAAINRGNSGGPLFNTKGDVVGINAAIFSPTGGNVGIGFAVPSVLAKGVIDQLKQYGMIHRGWLGVKIQLVNEEIADSLGLGKPRGALVVDVSQDSPARGSGLAVGDVIVKFDGRDIDEMRKLPRVVADSKIGKKVDMVVWRDGKEVTISTKVGELPLDEDGAAVVKPTKNPEAAPMSKDLVLGLQLVPITPDLRAQFQLKPSVKGLIVDALDRTGEAGKKGIVPGDVIVQVNQQPVDSVEALKQGLKAAKKSGHGYALLQVRRGDEVVFVTVSLR
ncbi:MAG: DegQ family serine endoprotease [Pseudomonadota bacterium]